jgi:hypothetical protein
LQYLQRLQFVQTLHVADPLQAAVTPSQQESARVDDKAVQPPMARAIARTMVAPILMMTSLRGLSPNNDYLVSTEDIIPLFALRVNAKQRVRIGLQAHQELR